MAPLAPEHSLVALLKELRTDLRGVGELRTSVDALAQIASDLRDEQIRTRIVNEDATIAMRELRDAVRLMTRMLLKTG